METMTIHFVSNLRMSFGLNSDDTIVMKAIAMDTYPA